MTVSRGAGREDAVGPVPENFEEAGRRIEAELRRRRESPMTLSAEARVRLELLNAEYLGDLGTEAVRLARRDRLTTVDREHVDRASARIGSGEAGRAASALNSVGGVVGGIGLASAYAVAFGPGVHGTAEVVIAIVACVLGAILLTAGVVLTLTRTGR